eukprot:909317-Pyramimonas_sp.AAC.1
MYIPPLVPVLLSFEWQQSIALLTPEALGPVPLLGTPPGYIPNPLPTPADPPHSSHSDQVAAFKGCEAQFTTRECALYFESLGKRSTRPLSPYVAALPLENSILPENIVRALKKCPKFPSRA